MTHSKSISDDAREPLRFSLAERDRRYAAVRARMRERGIDCLLIPHHTGEWDNYQADTRYLSSLGGGGAATALLFPLEGEPVAVVREERRIPFWREQQDWIVDVRAPKAFRWAGVFIDALRERGLTGSRVGVVGLKDVLRDAEGTAAYGEIRALCDAFPKLEIESAIDIMNAVRKRKSAEEIAIMRRAQLCADAIGEALRTSASPGVREHDVYAAITAAHISSGGETPTMILFAADTRMWQTHLLPRFRRVGPEDIVVIEAEAKFAGYMVQSVETVPLRPLTRDEERLLEVSKACFSAVVDAMRPGVAYAYLIALWERTATGGGYRPGRTMGHGLGLGQDGPLTTRGGRAGNAVVEEGDCFVLKPWIEDESGKISGRVGANVIVERGRAVVLGTSGLSWRGPSKSMGRSAG